MTTVSSRPLTNVPLRLGISFLTLVELVIGVVATLTPRVFYDDVPWVSLAPPYSEHLMRDFGAMNLALTNPKKFTPIEKYSGEVTATADGSRR
jgi:hypothetical protein